MVEFFRYWSVKEKGAHDVEPPGHFYLKLKPVRLIKIVPVVFDLGCTLDRFHQSAVNAVA
jgi:hypothetical protein